jgi:hypothetical protein
MRYPQSLKENIKEKGKSFPIRMVMLTRVGSVKIQFMGKVILKINYWLDREQLLRNLKILGPPVSKRDVCFRITIDLASRSVTDHAMGYGDDSTGFFWLPLWKPGT